LGAAGLEWGNEAECAGGLPLTREGEPRMSSELETYAFFFNRHHDAAQATLAGLPVEALNWRPLPVRAGEAPDTNTLAGLGTHVAGSQRYWLGEMFHGRNPARDREAELAAHAGGWAELLADLDEAAQRVQATLAGMTPEGLTETVQYRNAPVTKRWMINHMLAHVAGHLAEMALIRQLWEAAQAAGGRRQRTVSASIQKRNAASWSTTRRRF